MTDTVAPPAIELHRREKQILPLLAKGLTNQEIGKRIYVSENTVKTYLKTMYDKLGVHNRVTLIVRAIQLGLLEV